MFKKLYRNLKPLLITRLPDAFGFRCFGRHNKNKKKSFAG